jgi:glycosyltransferase involved in cell wall biosynthesis
VVRVLHLTAHLGGGVGKALSGLVAQANESQSGVRHLIACLEEPEKSQFIDSILSSGGHVVVCPSQNRLETLIADSDIVQLEWWNHPATIKCLCSMPVRPIRLLAWSHVSGLHNPIIPQRLITASHRFLFTSPCSYQSRAVRNLAPQLADHLGVVSSSGGFSGLPQVHTEEDEGVSAGYIGSLNFAKLHPCYVDYLAAVEIPGFRVRMIGDLTNQNTLNQRCDYLGRVGMLDFRGYSTHVASELAAINVLAYLLNPEHYGTTENALLEAMAAGTVPIVLDNPCERQIVDDGVTGLVVHSPHEFAQAIRWLNNNPADRRRLASRAAQSVRERFSAEKMEVSLNAHYRHVLSMEKRKIVFSEIFGADPAEWFLSCQDDKSFFGDDGTVHSNGRASLPHALFEKTKGTAFHFSAYFPNNPKLKLWAKNLKSLEDGKRNGDR